MTLEFIEYLLRIIKNDLMNTSKNFNSDIMTDDIETLLIEYFLNKEYDKILFILDSLYKKAEFSKY